MLYRNDFFSNLPEKAIENQVFVLDEAFPFPVSASIPFLENFSAPWETEIIRRGPDGFLYLRVKEKGKAQNEVAYFRAHELGGEAEKISVGAWRNSDNPEILDYPSPVTAILKQAAASSGVSAARMVSPDFSGMRFLAAPYTAPVDRQLVMNGYCRDTPEPLAVAILADGRGFYCKGNFSQGIPSQGSGPATEQFSLPALPAGFAYTGIALLGNVLAAVWEEQQEAGIGAAGFMLVKLFF